ncbi:hypothetical protein ERO13_D09G130200v2 [Gossypium hirsutum]|uniref:Uncharacterized protein n=1 Tax=Gossypium tomentosum TaxID=34277 RepID=A0A5D2JIK7_GOSTO|nr:hypothetical protein ERO13_D09G130200v2 [Gossypium hirsutum]TYH54275.1 hypothetical protein ES332_D09G157000v1 [Gossypium tomentosum]
MSRAASAPHSSGLNSNYGGVNQDAAFPPLRYGVQSWGRGMYGGEGARVRRLVMCGERARGRHCCDAGNPCC